MNSEHRNFIETYYNVFPDGYCAHLIKQFDLLASNGAGQHRLKSDKAFGHVKDDYLLYVNLGGQDSPKFGDSYISDIFFSGLQQCYEEYTTKYSVLRDSNLRASVMKMQRTDPGGGYHVWHAEQGRGDAARRGLVYMLYLNTLTPEQAGETEFLYQQERYRPIENTMLLWPAGFTHPHRGNTVFGQSSKYIVTGWFYHE